jgi:hypothetical protein
MPFKFSWNLTMTSQPTFSSNSSVEGTYWTVPRCQSYSPSSIGSNTDGPTYKVPYRRC